jgi:hypothetical protein
MWEERICCARFWRWHVPHDSISVTRVSWWRGETSCITVWQPVQATPRPSCALPCQKRCGPLEWHVRQAAFRFSTGVLSFRANEIIPPTPLPPPASACF